MISDVLNLPENAVVKTSQSRAANSYVAAPRLKNRMRDVRRQTVFRAVKSDRLPVYAI